MTFSITYTFSPGTTIQSGQVNQNFTDVVNALNSIVSVTYPVAINNGGTGAVTAAAALSNLGAAPIASPALTGTPTAPTASAGTNTTQLATTAFVLANAVTVPTGSVVDFAGFTVPTGWLLCAGQAVSRTTYATLFAALGTAYGAGDGSTTFNVPDLRGRTVFGLDNMGGSAAGRLTGGGATANGLNANALGATGGEQTHTPIVAELPSADPVGLSGKTIVIQGGTSLTLSTGGAGNVQTFGPATWSGAGQAFNEIPPAMALNKIIKT